MSKSILAVGTMVSAMVLASMAAGLTAVEGASQTRTVTLLDQAPRRDEPLEQPRRVCGHLDQRNGEPVAADVRRTNILGTYPLHSTNGPSPPRRLRGERGSIREYLITTPLPGTSARAENTSEARCAQPST